MAREDISQECWEAATQRANDPNTWTHGISAGSYFDSKGKPFGRSAGYICHAFMTGRDAPEDGKPFVFVNDTNLSKNSSSEKLVRKYFKYLCQESPVRNFVLNNDNFEQLINGGAIIDCLAAGSDATLWLCKAMRYPVEEPYRVKHWNTLVTLGVHPMLALCVASCVNADFCDTGGATHASVFYPPKTKDHLNNLFVDHLPDSTGWNNAGFVTSRVFMPKSTGVGHGWYNHLLPIPDQGGIKEKVPDGWGGYTLKPKMVSLEEVAEKLLELQKEFVE